MIYCVCDCLSSEKMGRACCVCKAGKNVNSHKFPKDPARRKKWIEELNLPSLNLLSVEELQKYRVCYNHFSAEDFRPTRSVEGSEKIQRALKHIPEKVTTRRM